VRAATAPHWWQRPPRKSVETVETQFMDLCRQRDERENHAARLQAGFDRIDGRLQTARRAAELLVHMTDSQRHRDDWLDAHPHEIAWHDTLRQQIAARCTQLGAQALEDRPAHLTAILGTPGSEMNDGQWAFVAGRIEAYRERWRLGPDELDRPHLAAASQQEHWRQTRLLLPESAAVRLEPGYRAEHGPRIELGM
jgi:hypothetical protein